MYEGFQFRTRLCFELSHHYIIFPLVACPSLFKRSRGRRELSYGPPKVEYGPYELQTVINRVTNVFFIYLSLFLSLFLSPSLSLSLSLYKISNNLSLSLKFLGSKSPGSGSHSSPVSNTYSSVNPV